MIAHSSDSAEYTNTVESSHCVARRFQFDSGELRVVVVVVAAEKKRNHSETERADGVGARLKSSVGAQPHVGSFSRLAITTSARALLLQAHDQHLMNQREMMQRIAREVQHCPYRPCTDHPCTDHPCTDRPCTAELTAPSAELTVHALTANALLTALLMHCWADPLIGAGTPTAFLSDSD